MATRIVIGIVVVLLLVLPLLVDPIALRRTASLIVLTLAVLGVIVATGYTGLITLGHGAFVGLGAFAMGAFLDFVGLPFLMALLVTFLFCGAVGWVLGLPALRIKGIYLALITLGAGVLFPSLAKRVPQITGGSSGRPIETSLEAPDWLGAEYTVAYRYFFCLAICGAMFLFTAAILRSRWGRAMQAVRDDETAAATFGVNLVLTKAGAFGLSAALAGIAGALQVVLFPFVSPEQFTVFLSFRLYAAAVIGGAAYVMGAIYGVLALILVPAINSAIGLFENDVFVFGAGLILLTFISPDGIAGWLRRTGRS
jgi:branched-chain amino acid transport system permease protein